MSSMMAMSLVNLFTILAERGQRKYEGVVVKEDINNQH